MYRKSFEKLSKEVVSPTGGPENSETATDAPSSSSNGSSNSQILSPRSPVETFKTNESPMIYRNEDTGWGWPPFFKFDTANLQAEASNAMLQGEAENPQWMVIRHYGWRNEFLSIYPNALSLRVASGPEEKKASLGAIF